LGSSRMRWAELSIRGQASAKFSWSRASRLSNQPDRQSFRLSALRPAAPFSSAQSIMDAAAAACLREVPAVPGPQPSPREKASVGSVRPLKPFSVPSTLGAGPVSSSPEGTAWEAGASLRAWDDEDGAVEALLAAVVQPARNRASEKAAQNPAARMRDQRLLFIADDLLETPDGAAGSFVPGAPQQGAPRGLPGVCSRAPTAVSGRNFLSDRF